MYSVLGRVCCPQHVTSAAAVANVSLTRMQLVPSSIRVRFLTATLVLHKRRGQTAVSATAPAKQQKVLTPGPRPLLKAEDAFYADSAQSFDQLGITSSLSESLRSAGFIKPSRVQELAIPHILSCKDVVLAAETGSGKTLAYIAPVASMLLQRAAAAAETSAAQAEQHGARRPHKQIALILCPNTALCRQVIRLVNSLTSSADNKPLLHACQVSSSNPPPFDPPDIVVTTPGALVTLFNDRGFNYGVQWTAEGVSNRALFVIVDEADLLSQGGYKQDLMRLLDAFKAGERRLLESQVMSELNMDENTFKRLPRDIKQACWESGVPGMIKAGYRLRKPSQQQQQQGDDLDPDQQRQQSSSRDSNSQQQYGPYFKRQYLFIAATMPAMTKADVGTELQRRFRNAVWVSGDMLHRIKPHVEHTWIKVPDSQPAAAAAAGSSDGDVDRNVFDALLAAIQRDVDYQAGRARVLVFARNTRNADKYSQLLSEHGIPNVLYHKDISKDDRDAALATMAAAAAAAPGSSNSSNVVMVSTDAASRGIDLPDITHVIQADFAKTAIDFLHRVGRTARAGKDGKVTSLYVRSDCVLAEAIQQYVAEGRPIEDCFSRNRSFGNKVKKYGQFVPRGQEGPVKGAKKQQQQQQEKQ